MFSRPGCTWPQHSYFRPSDERGPTPLVPSNASAIWISHRRQYRRNIRRRQLAKRTGDIRNLANSSRSSLYLTPGACLEPPSLLLHYFARLAPAHPPLSCHHLMKEIGEFLFFCLRISRVLPIFKEDIIEEGETTLYLKTEFSDHRRVQHHIYSRFQIFDVNSELLLGVNCYLVNVRRNKLDIFGASA